MDAEFDIVAWDELPPTQQAALLTRPAVADDSRFRGDAEKIISSVREQGDAAIIDCTARLDGVAIDELRVPPLDFDAAAKELSAEAKRAINLAIDNVGRFHAAQKSSELDIATQPGIRCQRVSQPLDSVGLYVPAGSAPLPSTAVMLCVPATIAGCPEIVLCSPPRPDGRVDAAVLYTAQQIGVTHVFKIGGAQAIAAMAYGTESVPRVAKIFGPGNAWVTAAKSLVSTDPNGAAIDMPAGPSEVLVIADESARPHYVAADLLSQAEHGVDSQVVLVCTSYDLARAVASTTKDQLAQLARRDIAARSMRESRFIVATDLDQAVAISNRYAPEHLIVQTENPRELLPMLRNAGSVFLGPWTPEAVGDYCSGTNHVLPTYGMARSYSGLGIDQFLRSMTIQELTPAGFSAIAEAVIELATLEGLDGHAEAIRQRMPDLPARQS